MSYLSFNGLNRLWSHIAAALKKKVDKVDGKTLSTNDYTTSEKNKLAGVSSGAEVNQNAFSTMKIGSNSINATNKEDMFEIVSGSNITITPNTISKKITINATDTKYSAATTTSSGLMSASDKVRLDNVVALVGDESVEDQINESVANLGVLTIDTTDSDAGVVPYTNSDMLGGLQASAYALKTDIQNYIDEAILGGEW